MKRLLFALAMIPALVVAAPTGDSFMAYEDGTHLTLLSGYPCEFNGNLWPELHLGSYANIRTEEVLFGCWGIKDGIVLLQLFNGPKLRISADRFTPWKDE